MRLYEYEGKRLFSRYGIPVPQGGLWPDDAAGTSYPAAVKIQLLEGGRGKRGGIQFAEAPEQAAAIAERLLAGQNGLPPAAAVLVEQKLDIAREFYLSLLVDREERCPVLLASAEGGVEIESVPDEQILRLDINPLLGLPGFVSRLVADRLGLSGRDNSDLAAILSGIWQLYQAEDAMLVEINPLVLTGDGRLIAADARIVLDESARWRHPEWPAPREGTEFERACAAIGAAGSELDGDIAVIGSGAGLGLSTVDMVSAFGGSLRCFVDLGGTVFQGAEGMGKVVALARDLQPKAMLLNSFFQFARCDILATGIADAFRERPPDFPVVVRMRGNMAAEAAEILAPFHFYSTGDMETACRVVIEAARTGKITRPEE